jgi:putative beta-lysine N-acetyltransferase
MKTTPIQVYDDLYNNRIRIDFYSGPLSEVYQEIISLEKDWVEKTIVKTKPNDLPYFLSKGFYCEGYIKGYFDGLDMYFMCRYHNKNRSIDQHYTHSQHIVYDILKSPISPTKASHSIRLAGRGDASILAELYKQIFDVYPTPVQQENHILKTMDGGTKYAMIFEENTLVSAASAEINRAFKNAELTDCASLPGYRGKGHMVALLQYLSELLLKEEITCHYTLSRSQSYGMNKAFYNLGYEYGGRLINNCKIYSGRESMNVWYKKY